MNTSESLNLHPTGSHLAHSEAEKIKYNISSRIEIQNIFCDLQININKTDLKRCDSVRKIGGVECNSTDYSSKFALYEEDRDQETQGNVADGKHS